jgi:hypothetical protein
MQQLLHVDIQIPIGQNIVIEKVYALLSQHALELFKRGVLRNK